VPATAVHHGKMIKQHQNRYGQCSCVHADLWCLAWCKRFHVRRFKVYWQTENQHQPSRTLVSSTHEGWVMRFKCMHARIAHWSHVRRCIHCPFFTVVLARRVLRAGGFSLFVIVSAGLWEIAVCMSLWCTFRVVR